jgi:hypothetical protein
VQASDGVACCRLTRHSSGRLRRRLIPALGFKSAFGSVPGQRQRLGRASYQHRFFVGHPAGLRVPLAGALSAFATCAPVFVRAPISFSAGAVRRNVTTSSAVRLSCAVPHHFAFLWCVWCGTIVHQRSGLGFRLTVRSRRTAAPPLNSSVRRQSIFLRSASRVSRLGFVWQSGGLLFQAGLRCCLSCAWPSVVSCARWRMSRLRTLSCARFAATWRSSPAARSSRAGRKLRGIAGLSKQRYRVRTRRGNRAAV